MNKPELCNDCKFALKYYEFIIECQMYKKAKEITECKHRNANYMFCRDCNSDMAAWNFTTVHDFESKYGIIDDNKK